MTNKPSEIIRHALETGIKQTELAEFFGVTRQTIRKIADGNAPTVHLHHLFSLEAKTKEEIQKMMKIKQATDEIIKRVFNIGGTVLEDGHEAIQYLHHWCTDAKYETKYINYLFGHVVNFHMRYNPYRLFLHDYFDKAKRPILSFNIDYENKQVIDFYLLLRSNFEKQNRNFEEHISFESFIDRLYERLDTSKSVNVYLDCEDDELAFIESHISQEYLKKWRSIDIYDISRCFRHLGSESKVGPLLEQVLKNFNITFVFESLINNSRYKTERISMLIDKIIMADIIEDDKDKFKKVFDGTSRGSTKNYVQEQRRLKKIEMRKKR